MKKEALLLSILSLCRIKNLSETTTNTEDLEYYKLKVLL